MRCASHLFLAFLFGCCASTAHASTTWTSNGDQVCALDADQQFLAAAPDGIGGVFLTFFVKPVGGDPLPEAYVRHYSRAGVPYDPLGGCGTKVFIASGNLSTHSAGQLRITNDGRRGAIIACANGRGSTQDIYAQRVDAHGVRQWGVLGVAVCTAAGDQTFADETFSAICSDGVGGAFVVWEDPRAGGSNVDIFMQHLSDSGAVVPGWPSDGLQVCGATGNQRRASIVPDGEGGVICVWSDPRSALTLPDIYASRFDASGNLVSGWTPDGTLVCGATGEQSKPVLVSDGADGAIIAWQDGRAPSTNFDIYAAHIRGDGVVDTGGGWAISGRLLCAASEAQVNPELVSDGAGGAIATWMDRRTATSQDVYAQHVTNTGAIASGWATDGQSVVTAVRDQAFPKVATDGSGGAIICWDDKRADASADSVDIYALRLQAGGASPAGWATDGNAVCTAVRQQTLPVIAPSDPGSAFVAWLDDRLGAERPDRIFFQRMTSDGEAGGDVAVPPHVPSHTEFSVTPNPTRSAVGIFLRLAAVADMSITVHDVTGRQVVSLVDSRPLGPGRVQLSWNLRDEVGSRVPSGTYWLLARSELGVLQRAVVVLR